MKPSVEKAIEQVRRYFPSSKVEAKEDGSGGAYVLVDPVDLGPDFLEESRFSWVGFQLSCAYPIADIYPHHVRPDLKRVSGPPLREGFHPNHRFAGFELPSTMLSRRTSQGSWSEQSALIKLLKVIEWAGGNTDRKAA